MNMERQKIIRIAVGILLFLAVVGVVYFGSSEKGSKEGEDDNNPTVSLFDGLDPNFKNCGKELLDTTRDSYNEPMRLCFLESFGRCELAKLQQEAITVEGDSIITTIVIEGRAPRGCKAHLYIDNRDQFGSPGESDTICYSVIPDTDSGQLSLLFTECEDRSQRFLY